MIFVDPNVPMYLVGGPHPHKTDSQMLLERLIVAGERLVTDAMVLQEIVHRYAAINKREAVEAILNIVDDIFAIEKRNALRGAEIVKNRSAMSARIEANPPDLKGGLLPGNCDYWRPNTNNA